MVHAHHSALIALAIVACSATRSEPVGVSLPRPSDDPASGSSEKKSPCPPEMADIEGAFCIDRWEAVLEGHSPYEMPKGKKLKAASRPGVVPQAYISREEADDACKTAGKRLCAEADWLRACRGPKKTQWTYGPERKAGYCNDSGVGPLGLMPPEQRAVNMVNMNNPRLNQLPNTVAKTGEYSSCTNEYGVFDMNGNLHEWVAGATGAPSLQSAFLGGYYLDVTINGSGCDYKTSAHESWYHDYSIGFRCCLYPQSQ
jgi:formylglycine-generating enzyme required for sulfatase activity